MKEKLFIKIDELRMVVRHIGMQPKFVEYVNRQLQMGRRARFPLTRTVMKTRVISAQESSANIVDLFNGRLPTSLVFGLVDNSAFRGDLELNPYNFQHFNLTNVKLLVNSK